MVIVTFQVQESRYLLLIKGSRLEKLLFAVRETSAFRYNGAQLRVPLKPIHTIVRVDMLT